MTARTGAMMTARTVAAISTPDTTGSIAMIRVSGENAIEIAEKIFIPANGKPVSGMAGYTAAYGSIRDKTKLDDGVLLVYRAPKSYTGEDVAEITCHGGVYVARKVLQACINAGARLAEAGEFTKRALLNGKMSLTQAESVIDVINSANGRYLACSNAQKDGALFRKTEEIADKILGVSAHIAALLDYPEEGGAKAGGFEISSRIGLLDDCRLQLSSLLESHEIGRIMREGVITAIVGKTNAGKSTLMNLMTRDDRSIVTDIPGTTRDVIEETVNMDGAVLRLCDCAGIRETGDAVEKIGIELMLKRIEEAALILAVFDNSRPLEKEDYALIEKIAGKTVVCVINKIDLESKTDLSELSARFGNTVKICAKDGASLNALVAAVNGALGINAADLSAGFIANERQRVCALDAKLALTEAIAGIENGAPLDATGFWLENALDALYRLSGKRASARIIDEVFKNFCVGK
ncbi:MAG: tRNA uridine-5-carboxymethylaminomethyl(34) synthesis GTPase MnmE [Oscillospiraceae bacterium]|nr:tRNA uridine-5-carboxymethylaminomethyl(34) synthesis GTPase MnmE [Oscillospiraceae bacterium]